MSDHLEEARSLSQDYDYWSSEDKRALVGSLAARAIIEALALSTTNDERADKIRALVDEYGLGAKDIAQMLGHEVLGYEGMK